MRLAIPLTLRVVTIENGVATETDTEFIPNAAFPVQVVFDKGTKFTFEATMSDNVAYVSDMGTLPVGVYSVTVLCRNGENEPLRFKQNMVLNVVDTSAEAGIEPGVEYIGVTHTLDAAVFWNSGTHPGLLPNGVVIDQHYVHTDNNFTDEYKEQLDNMTPLSDYYTSAQVDEMFSHYSTSDQVAAAIAASMYDDSSVIYRIQSLERAVASSSMPHVFLSETEYNNLAVKDPNTIYFTFEE